jgi:hypothetical protein
MAEKMTLHIRRKKRCLYIVTSLTTLSFTAPVLTIAQSTTGFMLFPVVSKATIAYLFRQRKSRLLY